MTAEPHLALAAGILRRHFVAIATGTYNDPTWGPLPVSDEVDALSHWLTDPSLGERAFSHDFPHLAADPDRRAIEDAFCHNTFPWNARDAAVVFITGHGEVTDQGTTHWTVLRSSDHSWHSRASLRTTDVVAWLRSPDGPTHVLLIIDTCFAGAIEEAVVRSDQSLPATWLILPSATKNGKARALALSSAIRRTVDFLGAPEGQKVGTHDRYLTVADFLDTLREQLRKDSPDQQVDPIYRGQMLARHVCLPNPHYRVPDSVPTEPARRDLALPRRDLEWHWRPRALGAGDADTGQPSRWLFTGRAPLMRELIATAGGDRDGESLVTLVTGGPGCGKSAVLARMVTLSDPQFCAAYPEEVAAIPDDLRPALGQVDAAIVATNRYPTEVIAQLARAFDLPAEDILDPSALGTALRAHWQSLAQIPTIVIDAIDEAHDPQGILTALKSLVDSGRARFLLGVRTLPESMPGSRAELVSLADRAERLLGARRLTVDEDPWWDQADLREYAAAILTTTNNSPYTDAAGVEAAFGLADVIASRVGRSFLVTRLAATNLTRRETRVASVDPEWLSTLDDDVVGVFRDDLHRARRTVAERRAAVDLLRAIAFSYGRGLPWGEIWPTVANAIADKHGAYGDRDIADLLASPLGAYLVTDVEDDTTVYRLFHQALRDTFRTDWQKLLDNDDELAENEIREVEARITRHLRGLIHLEDDQSASPPWYFRRHLAEHASAGSCLTSELVTANLLPHLDNVVLREALGHPRRGDGLADLEGLLRSVAHVWDDARVDTNRAALALWGGPQYASRHAPWRVRWSRLPRPNHQVLTRSIGPVSAVATAALPDGRVVTVTGSTDHTVRVWDLTTGTAVGPPLTGHTGKVAAVATAVLPDGRAVAVTGSWDATVRVWDLTTGTPVGPPLTGHTSMVAAVATAVLPDGRAVAVTGSWDATVRVWDLTTGTPVGPPLTGHTSMVAAVATAVLPDGRAVAVTGSWDDTVRVWDLTTGTPAAQPLTGHTSWVVAVATAALPDGRVVAVSGSDDGTVRVWDLTTGTPAAQLLTGHTGTVAAVATAVLPNGRVVAVTGSDDGTVRVWDLTTDTPAAQLPTGHTGTVAAVATAVLPGGRVVAVTGSDGGTVRVWDLDTGAPAGQLLTGPIGGVGSLATAVLPGGRVVAVTGSRDDTVRVWDLATGTPIGDSMNGHTNWVVAVATAALPDGRVVAVTGSWDDTVRVWDLATGTPIGEPMTGHTSMVVAVATAALPDGRVVAVTGSWDATVSVWDLTTGTPVGHRMTGHTDRVMAVATAVLPDGRPVAVTGSRDATVRVWDLTTATPIGEPMTGHTGTVEAVAIATLPDGRVVAVTGSYDSTVRMWDLDLNHEIAATQPVPQTGPLAFGHIGDHLVLVLGVGPHLVCLEPTDRLLHAP